MEYDKDVDINKEFSDKYRILQNAIEDLNRCVLNKDFQESSNFLDKIEVVGYRLKNIFEMKQNILILSNQENLFMRN